jgi:small subunit ribosomal protein S17
MPRRVFEGKVVSDKNNKTVIVEVEKSVVHPIYRKRMKRHCRYAAHDENNSFRVGDFVQIVESPPISKTKKWLVQTKISK